MTNEDMLKETFGIKIDKYIIVHDEAVEKIVDAKLEEADYERD